MNARGYAIAGALLSATLTVASASARDHEERERHERRSRDERGRAATPPDPRYAKECGACHLAYPPRFLPAASWRALFSGLDHHFGQDAALEPEARAGIERWVLERSGPDRRPSADPALRITEVPWFRREHDEVPAGAAVRPSVRSLANCAACHPGAERWDFDEDRVTIPGH